MDKVYFKINISDANQNILDESLSNNPFTLRRTIDGKSILISFKNSNIPIDLLKWGYIPIEDIVAELNKPEWNDSEEKPAIIDNKVTPLNIVSPFGSKVLSNGKKLFRRVHGISASVQDQPDTIDFVVPYPQCKITGVQILGGKLGDKCNFMVLDSVDGVIQQSMGVALENITPNLQLNQFGFNVNIIPDVASYPSKYDADLVQGMVLRVVYDAVDELIPRTIYINFDLHQVTD